MLLLPPSDSVQDQPVRLSQQLLSVQNFNEEQRRISLISKDESQNFSAVVPANVVNQTGESRFIYNNQPVAENNPVASPSEVIVEVHKPSATLSSAPILGDPGAYKEGQGKSKRAEKYIWNEEK